jgi:hypothetical protein
MPVNDDFDPSFGRPPCPYTREDCLPGCEHGYAGPCERLGVGRGREWIPGPPPGETRPANDDIDQRLESAMLTLDMMIQDVSSTIFDFRRGMVKLRRAIQFLFAAFVVLGICLLVLAWTSLP